MTMRNKFSKKLNTQIELTSLLDVIFIVLMVVICNQQINMTAKNNAAETVMEQAQEQMEEAEDLKAEAEAEKELLKEHKDTYEAVNEVTDVLTVYVDFTPSNPEERAILIMAGDEELPHIQMSPSNESEALSQFEELLEKKVSDAEKNEKPVIISVNKDRILYRDEKAVSRILDRLFEKHDNIFYKKTANQ